MGNRGKKFVFVIGGARSGKSSFALKFASAMPGEKTYMATGAASDPEMKVRIETHKRSRGNGWKTIEEPRNIAAKLLSAGRNGVILLDCLTLWISNLMEAGLTDDEIMKEAEAFAASCRKVKANVVAVSNETGQGIVPENRLARRFRDVSGLVNQMMAQEADSVYFVAAGIPVKIK
ncbi:MAG: bifunctional adenosylcobinamide kinase/adenosylcobinamide-phosphate guanylyltransferase [Deltaproteobacteria bacterium]|nr:bifunctional adenosylcobinamide kinase/adenosylcobinamide-phosphate guanylyltransferase [Deltaproteobacteria bacterium]